MVDTERRSQLPRLRHQTGMTPIADLRAVLFDLDGTLVDSAPDLIAALQILCAEIGETAADPAKVRPAISGGGRAILRRGLPNADEKQIEELLPRYLDIYSRSVAVATRLYDGMDDVLLRLEALGIPWGVVTNKAGWLAQPLMDQLDLSARSGVLVAGDTLAVRKPDPQPVIHACETLGIDPAKTIYIGDDPRDIAAGRGAGTTVIAAAWGYLDGGDPYGWGADYVVDAPADLPAIFGIDGDARTR